MMSRQPHSQKNAIARSPAPKSRDSASAMIRAFATIAARAGSGRLGCIPSTLRATASAGCQSREVSRRPRHAAATACVHQPMRRSRRTPSRSLQLSRRNRTHRRSRRCATSPQGTCLLVGGPAYSSRLRSPALPCLPVRMTLASRLTVGAAASTVNSAKVKWSALHRGGGGTNEESQNPCFSTMR
jgi:hypothetical protein